MGDDGRDRFGHAVAVAEGPGAGSTGPAEEPEPWVFSVDRAAAVDQPPAAPPREPDQPVAAQRPAPTGPVEEPPAWTAPVTASHDEGDHALEVDEPDAHDRRYELDDDTFGAASLEAAVAELGFSLETADEGVAERDVERPSDDRWAAQEAGTEGGSPAAGTTVPPDEDETDSWRLDLDEFGLDLGAASDPDVDGTVTTAEEQAGEEPESVQPAWDVSGGQPATDQPSWEQPTWDRPAEQQAAWDQPVEALPAADQPTRDQRTWDQPAGEEPTWDQAGVQPAADEPAGDQPAGDQLAWDQPGDDEPTWQPAGDQLAWDQPGDDEPTWQPAGDQPAGGTATTAADPNEREPAGPSAEEQGHGRRRPPLDLDRFVARPSGARRGRFRRR